MPLLKDRTTPFHHGFDGLAEPLSLFGFEVDEVKTIMKVTTISDPRVRFQATRGKLKGKPDDLADGKRMGDVYSHAMFVEIRADGLRATSSHECLVSNLHRQFSLMATWARYEHLLRLFPARECVHFGHLDTSRNTDRQNWQELESEVMR